MSLMLKIRKTDAARSRNLGPGIPGGRFSIRHPLVQNAKKLQNEITKDVMKEPGVFGTGIGIDDKGHPILQIYVDKNHADSEGVTDSIIKQFSDVALQVHIREKFKPQSKPFIPCLGTSGSLALDITTDGCCTGTLGALVWIGGVQYILSNWHVLEGSTYELELCTSWNMIGGGGQGECGSWPCGSCIDHETFTRPCATGDPVVSPGLIDLDPFPCAYWLTQIVGFLEKKNSLPGNNVDCAVAQLRTGLMRSDGHIKNIGVPSATTIPATLGLPVQKNGRTTDFTTGTVTSISLTVSIDYSNSCGGATAFTKTYTDQIQVTGDSGPFSAEGDSGSLVVDVGSAHPHAVGLLFAGGGSDSACNPIDDVLAFLGATMVGV